MASITEVQDDRGSVFQYGSAVFHSPNDMPGLGGEPLRAGLRSTASIQAQLAADMLPDRLPARLMEIAGPATFSAAGDAINIARRAASDAIAADARLMEPAHPVDPAVAVEHRTTVRALKADDQHRWIEQANLEGLTAIVDGGNRTFLRPELWEAAVERFWIENWITRHNAQAGHPAEPSLDTVLAIGPDDGAVRDEAVSIRRRHLARMATIGEMEAAAKRLVDFLAAVFATSAEEALDRTMGRHDAQAA